MDNEICFNLELGCRGWQSELGFFVRVLSLVTMAGRRGGSSSPSYSQVVAERSNGTGSHSFKKPTEVAIEATNTEKSENIRPHGQEENHKEASKEKRTEVSSKKVSPMSKTGVCKPKLTTIPRVILSDLALQVHRDHMAEYAVICKFMGISLMEKVLQAWIRND